MKTKVGDTVQVRDFDGTVHSILVSLADNGVFVGTDENQKVWSCIDDEIAGPWRWGE